MDIRQRVLGIMDLLEQDESNAFIEGSYVRPFRGSQIPKLVIIGQDPTIRDKGNRSNIECTLNLDKSNGALKVYICRICHELGYNLENIYATNLFKYKYDIPPSSTMDVLVKHLKPNLDLLCDEISEFPTLPIITLGEPVLQLLFGESVKLKSYWGYGYGGMMSSVKQSKLGRTFYPFPHQPSMRKPFYKDNFAKYCSFMKLQEQGRKSF